MESKTRPNLLFTFIFCLIGVLLGHLVLSPLVSGLFLPDEGAVYTSVVVDDAAAVVTHSDTTFTPVEVAEGLEILDGGNWRVLVARRGFVLLGRGPDVLAVQWSHVVSSETRE